MNNNRIKDLKATIIVLIIISIPTCVYLISEYASRETKEMFAIMVTGILSLGFIFIIWKGIRLLID